MLQIGTSDVPVNLQNLQNLHSEFTFNSLPVGEISLVLIEELSRSNGEVTTALTVSP